MSRVVCVLLTGIVLLSCSAGHAWCASDDVDLRARVLIGSLGAGGGPDPFAPPGELDQSGRKSVARAMLLSAVIPGLGQIYAGGRRGYAVGGAMAATDAFSVWRYLVNTGDGDDKKSEYRAWADEHFNREDFKGGVIAEIAPYNSQAFEVCRGDDPDWAACADEIWTIFQLSPSGTDEYYEEIDRDDRYVLGWDDWEAVSDPSVWNDWDPYTAPPAGVPTLTPNKETYRSMRDEADDSYGKASSYAWIMVINRVISMVDAAIMVKLRNRDLASIGTNPRLSFKAGLGSNPHVKVGLKLRF